MRETLGHGDPVEHSKNEANENNDGRAEPHASIPSTELVSSPHAVGDIRREVSKLDSLIAQELADLNQIREGLGLSPAYTSAAISALQERREKLLLGAQATDEAPLNSPLAVYIRSLGQSEVIRRLEKLPPAAFLKLRGAIADENLPLAVHLLELPIHADLQKKSQAGDITRQKYTRGSSFLELQNALNEMDKVTQSHTLATLEKIKSFKQEPQNKADRSSDELLDLLRNYFN